MYDTHYGLPTARATDEFVTSTSISLGSRWWEVWMMITPACSAACGVCRTAACDEVLAMGTWNEFLRYADQSGADYTTLTIGTLAELLRQSAARAYKKNYIGNRTSPAYVSIG